MPYTYQYPRPALTVDCVVFGFDEAELKLLMIKRGIEPFKDKWALPGGFVHVDEEIEVAARRELQEETGMEILFLEQLCAVGKLNRDPRERIVSVAHYALVKMNGHALKADTDATDAKWFAVSKLPEPAFDHGHILKTGLEQLRKKLRHEPIGLELLPDEFTLAQLQKLYESVLGKSLNKSAFQKKIMSLGLLVPGKRKRAAGHHARTEPLYRFDLKQYKKLQQKGFHFEV